MHGSSSATRRKALWLFVAFVSGCQVALGDYEVDRAAVPPSMTGTGGEESGTGGTPTLPPGSCNAGERRCEEAVLTLCVDGREQRQTCSSPARCDQANARCNTCVEGETQCRDAKTPQRCDAAANRWVTDGPCSGSDVCDPTVGRCVACESDIGVCVSETVLCRCNATQTAFQSIVCETRCDNMGTRDRCLGEGSAGGPSGACDNI